MQTPAGSGKPVDLLVEAFRQGRPGAFDAIVQAPQDRVFAFCARMLSDREEALDAAQDVFLSAWRNLSAFRGDSRVPGQAGRGGAAGRSGRRDRD